MYEYLKGWVGSMVMGSVGACAVTYTVTKLVEKHFVSLATSAVGPSLATKLGQGLFGAVFVSVGVPFGTVFGLCTGYAAVDTITQHYVPDAASRFVLHPRRGHELGRVNGGESDL